MIPPTPAERIACRRRFAPSAKATKGVIIAVPGSRSLRKSESRLPISIPSKSGRIAARRDSNGMSANPAAPKNSIVRNGESFRQRGPIAATSLLSPYSWARATYKVPLELVAAETTASGVMLSTPAMPQILLIKSPRIAPTANLLIKSTVPFAKGSAASLIFICEPEQTKNSATKALMPVLNMAVEKPPISRTCALKLIEDAKALEAAGVFSIVIECVPSVVAKAVTEAVSVPVLGIGAGPDVDCQVLVTHDLLDMYGDFKPKFVKHFAHIREEMVKGLNLFHEETLSGEFPTPEYSFNKAVDIPKLY